MLSKKTLTTLALPILLLHGYTEDYHVWDSWVSWLKIQGFSYDAVKAVNFDKCGSVKQHAAELTNAIDNILNATHAQKVNIIAHSKGGLDARWYISHSRIDNVANLIMISTPNQGTTAAYIDLTSCAGSNIQALRDMLPGSDATQVQDSNNNNNKQTHYFTIAGNYATPCYFIIQRFSCYISDSDGLVTVSSAQSTYPSLGVFHYNHTGLLTHKDVYEKVLPILLH